MNHIHISRVLRLHMYTTVKVWHKPYPHIEGSSITHVHNSERMTWTISTPPGFFGYASTQQWTYDINHIHTARVLRLHKYTPVNGWNEPYLHLQGSMTNASTTLKVRHEIYPQFKVWHEVYTQFKVWHEIYPQFQCYSTDASTYVPQSGCDTKYIHSLKSDMKYMHNSKCDMKHIHTSRVI